MLPLRASAIFLALSSMAAFAAAGAPARALAAPSDAPALAITSAATPCPTPKPVAELASPAPCPSVAGLKEIGSIRVLGRKAQLVGKALSASEGTIGRAEIEYRPLYRPAEVLEAIPGLVISQHSGAGKANQYYLRGFNLDHGTDIASSIVGVPINEPTHAHGQGYSDINWLLPELIGYIEYKKGPYFADEGDFSTAGAYNLYYRDTLPSTVSVSAGDENNQRVFVAASPRLGSGHLLYAFEAYHYDGYYKKPDNYRRFNGVLRYSRTSERTNFNLTAMGYSGRFDSTDQIPQRLVAGGALDRYGNLDPSDGGRTSRFSLSTQIEHQTERFHSRFDAYAVRYGLDLFSNFTYARDNATDYFNATRNPHTCFASFNTCTPGAGHTPYFVGCPADAAPAGPAGSATPPPFAFACGDQREQSDQRVTAGFSYRAAWNGAAFENSFGVAVRNDNIFNSGLYLTVARGRVATLVDDAVVQRQYSAYVQTKRQLTPVVRFTAGVRGDLYNFGVNANLPGNSGYAVAGLVSPKFALAVRTSAHGELYVNTGQSYHSNDARGATQTLDPQTHANLDPSGVLVERVTPLARAWGSELGYRLATAKLTTTLSAFKLDIASELTFGGDSGTTSAGRPTERTGFEIANFYTPTRGLTVDADFALSNARFSNDPAGIGTHVPGALQAVGALGITADLPGAFASLRTRYFGPRPLIEDGSAYSNPSTLISAQVGVKLRRHARLALSAFNVLGTRTNDIDYFYNSWTPYDQARFGKDPTLNPAYGGQGVGDKHFHPAETTSLTLTFSRAL